MTDEQKLFYEELRKIQEFAVGFTMAQKDKYSSTEEMLEDITYDMTYMFCELIDGYRNNEIKYNLVNIKNDNLVNDNIELHDWCEAFLRYKGAKNK